MKRAISIIGLIISGSLFSQNVPFDKLYGNSDPDHYYLGHYPIANSDGLDINWYGGIKLQTSTGLGIQLLQNGNVGIGTNNPQYKLDVAGKSSFADNMRVNAKIEAKEIKVTLTPTADFVFAEDYNLPKLEDVEKHIKEKKHLPEIASAKEMEKEGVNVGEFQIKLLQKIEELTLYIIEQNKEIKEDKAILKVQSEKITHLESQLKEIKTK